MVPTDAAALMRPRRRLNGMIAVTIIALTVAIDILKYQGSTIRFGPAITTVITTTPRQAATTFTHIFLERARNATGSAKAMTVIVFMPAPIQPSAPRPISAQRIPCLLYTSDAAD